VKLLVLSGLVVVEKAKLAQELAQYFEARGQSTLIIDNMARLPIDNQALHTLRLDDTLSDSLPAVLSQVDSEIAILAASERANPDHLFTTLELLYDQKDNFDYHSIALLDLRTCDCFPNLRERLEMYADTVVMLPYNLDDVIAHANI